MSPHYDSRYSPSAGKITASEHFLNLQREYVKQSPHHQNKSQDILMVGPLNVRNKKIEALKSLKDKLIMDGFTRIVFQDIDEGTETILADSGEDRTYRVLYTSMMSHPSMIACMGLSGELVGVTGDQSFGEGISRAQLKTTILDTEVFVHKENQIKDYEVELFSAGWIASDFNQEINYAKQVEELLESEKDLNQVHKNLIKKQNLIRAIAGNIALAQTSNDRLLEGYHLFERNKLDPLSIFTDGRTFFEQCLDENCYEIASMIIEKMKSSEQQMKLKEILSHKNHHGDTYLSQLRKQYPLEKSSIIIEMETSYSSALDKLDKLPSNSKTDKLVGEFKSLIKEFSTVGPYNDKALIGLLLSLHSQVVVSKKQEFFTEDSPFHATLESALKELGVNSKTISDDQKQGYKQSLLMIINENPKAFSNNSLFQALSLNQEEMTAEKSSVKKV